MLLPAGSTVGGETSEFQSHSWSWFSREQPLRHPCCLLEGIFFLPHHNAVKTKTEKTKHQLNTFNSPLWRIRLPFSNTTLYAFTVSAAQREADLLHGRQVEKRRAYEITDETLFTRCTAVIELLSSKLARLSFIQALTQGKFVTCVTSVTCLNAKKKCVSNYSGNGEFDRLELSSSPSQVNDLTFGI